MNGSRKRPEKTYHEFEIEIGKRTSFLPVYTLHVHSNLGDAEGKLELDIDQEGFRQKLARVRGDDFGLGLRQEVGQTLFDALFEGDVFRMWDRCMEHVRTNQVDGLRLRLFIRESHLAALPWELLYHKDVGFLATDGNQALCRYYHGTEWYTMPAQVRLRVLLVIASPRDKPVPSAAIEHLIGTVVALEENPEVDVEVKVLQNKPLADIQAQVRQGYHVLHFLGHGSNSELYFTDENQDSEPIDAEAFAQLLQGRNKLRLVVLNACSSGQDVEGGLFSGVGPALVEKRVPAVIAMQYGFVLADTAGWFSEQFYRFLAQGEPVDVAVNEARKYLLVEHSADDREWSAPVLYAGTRDARILTFHHGDVDALEQALEEAAEQVERSQALLGGVSHHFQRVAPLPSRLQEWLQLESHFGKLQVSVNKLLDGTEGDDDGQSPAKQLRSLKRMWNDGFTANLSELRSFVRGIQHTRQPVLTGGVGSTFSEVNPWMSELEPLSTNVAKALTQSIDEVEKQGWVLFCFVQDRHNDCRRRIDKEVQELSELTIELRSLLEVWR